MQKHRSDGVGLGIEQKIEISLRQTLDIVQHLPTREVEHRCQSSYLRCKAGLECSLRWNVKQDSHNTSAHNSQRSVCAKQREVAQS